MPQNFRRNKRQVEEAKRKKRQEKADKQFQRKAEENISQTLPENQGTSS